MADNDSVEFSGVMKISPPNSSSSATRQQARGEVAPYAIEQPKNTSTSESNQFRLLAESFYPTIKYKHIGAGDNFRTSQLLDIYKAIYSMSALPESDSYHLARRTAISARNLLALMTENFDFELPKLLNRDGDALSFTWRANDGKIFLTIDDTEIDLFALFSNGDEIEEQISDGQAIDLLKLFHLIGEQANASILR